MFFVFGSLSLVQIVFLPGSILLKLFKLRRGIIPSLVFSFGLSLIFNLLWVLLLVLFKINDPILHYLLFVIEMGLFFWLYWPDLSSSSEEIFSRLTAKFNEIIGALKVFFQKEGQETAFSRFVKSLISLIFFIWAISSLIWVIKILFLNFGTVFKLWDAVVSWNKWAEQWFNNIIPSPRRYAQLVPANFSITYSFLRSIDIQIFAKSFMPLFTLFTWLMILDLAFEYKKPGMFIGVVILRYMTKKFLFPYIGEGYVDAALLFFSFLTVYTLLKANKTQDVSDKTRYLFLGAVFAAGTALTKQNGLLIFATYPLLAILLVTDEMKIESMAERAKILLKPMILGLVVLLPWYVLNEYRIATGLNNTNVEFLISADRHSGRSYWERAQRAIEMLEVYKYLFLLVVVTLPLISKKFRQVAYITIFPYTIIWIFLFSIFVRNLAMVFPFLALIAGLGVEGLINFLLELAEKIKFQRIKAVYYFLPLILVIFGFGRFYTDTKLVEMQITDQKDALLSKVNQGLYDYFEDQGEFGTIMTHYPLNYLPGFEEYFLHEPFSIYKEFYENFSTHPEVEYFLVWDKHADDDVLDRIDQFRENGAIEFYFEKNDLTFYKVIEREMILEVPPN
jgi:hypothetical protein